MGHLYPDNIRGQYHPGQIKGLEMDGFVSGNLDNR
jgi:hypothetical protein